MPRIRSIKPEFFSDERLAEFPRDVRLTFLGLISHADDEGRLKGDPRLVKAQLWPLDDDITVATVENHLTQLSSGPEPRIVWYEVEGRRYIWVRNFGRHQVINKPRASTLPAPALAREASRSAPVVAPDNSQQEGSGVDGSGADGSGMETGREWNGGDGATHAPADSTSVRNRFFRRLPRGKLKAAYVAEFAAWLAGMNLGAGIQPTDADIDAALSDYLAEANPSFELPHLRSFVRRAVREREKRDAPGRGATGPPGEDVATRSFRTALRVATKMTPTPT